MKSSGGEEVEFETEVEAETEVGVEIVWEKGWAWWW